MRVKLTQKFVDEAKVQDKDIPKSGRTIYWDDALAGFGLVVTTAGHRSYICKYRADHHPRKMTIKATLKLADARKEAKAILGRVAKGSDPLAERRKAQASAARAGLDTLQAVCESYLVREGGMCRNADGSVTFEAGETNIRTGDERRKTFERLVYPKLGKRPIHEITRSDINDLLDKIEDGSGAPMANHTLAYLRRVFNWHAARVDGFHPPIVRGMARGVPNKRSRILGEDEVRAFWRAALAWENGNGDYGHPFPRLLRFTLLTATRRDEAARMLWSEIDNDDFSVWVIPAARYKTKIDFEVPLSGAALGILHEARRIKLGTAGYVFTTGGETPISGFSKWKAHFDALMLAERCKIAAAYGDDVDKITVPGWTIHDLRRTARSLMSQVGVAPDHAERALGHVIGGVRGVYDRHAYRKEKRQAFEALAARIDHILRTVRW